MALSNNIWWTRKARIQTEARLLANANQSQLILLWYSFFSVAVSIYYLKMDSADVSSVSWVVYSVMLLCMSGFINGQSYKERAALIKDCYEKLDVLSREASKNSANLGDLASQYASVLKACENHSDADFAIAVCREYNSSNPYDVTKSKELHADGKGEQAKLTKLPNWHHWFLYARYYLLRITVLFVLYALPIVLFTLLSTPIPDCQ